MSKMDRILIALIDGDPWRLEVSLGLYLLAYGLWLCLPLDTFSASTTFQVMKLWADEKVWGVALTGLGLAQMIISRRKLLYRRIVAALVLFSFSTIAYAMWLSGTTSTGPVTFTILSLMAAWSLLGLLGKVRS